MDGLSGPTKNMEYYGTVLKSKSIKWFQEAKVAVAVMGAKMVVQAGKRPRDTPRTTPAKKLTDHTGQPRTQEISTTQAQIGPQRSHIYQSLTFLGH